MLAAGSAALAFQALGSRPIAPTIDGACSSKAALRDAYGLLSREGTLRCFGNIEPALLPVPWRPLSTADMESLTRLPSTAFIPDAARRGRNKGAQLSAGVATAGIQMLLAAAAVEDRLPLRSLRELAWWQLPAIFLGLTGAITAVVARPFVAVPTVSRAGAVLPSLLAGRLPCRHPCPAGTPP